MSGSFKLLKLHLTPDIHELWSALSKVKNKMPLQQPPLLLISNEGEGAKPSMGKISSLAREVINYS